MVTISGHPLPAGFEMPKRISMEFIGVERDQFGRLRKVYYSGFGAVDITDMNYQPVKRSWFGKFQNWLRFGVWI
jgi:hypothetical protein